MITLICMIPMMMLIGLTKNIINKLFTANLKNLTNTKCYFLMILISIKNMIKLIYFILDLCFDLKRFLINIFYQLNILVLISINWLKFNKNLLLIMLLLLTYLHCGQYALSFYDLFNMVFYGILNGCCGSVIRTLFLTYNE